MHQIIFQNHTQTKIQRSTNESSTRCSVDICCVTFRHFSIRTRTQQGPRLAGMVIIRHLCITIFFIFFILILSFMHFLSCQKGAHTEPRGDPLTWVAEWRGNPVKYPMPPPVEGKNMVWTKICFFCICGFSFLDCSLCWNLVHFSKKYKCDSWWRRRVAAWPSFFHYYWSILSGGIIQSPDVNRLPPPKTVGKGVPPALEKQLQDTIVAMTRWRYVRLALPLFYLIFIVYGVGIFIPWIATSVIGCS